MRAEQQHRRDDQSDLSKKSAQQIKEEFDDINSEYLKNIERKKKADLEAVKKEEKKEIFEKDFINLAIGPEPKDENKKKTYEEKVQNLKNSKPQAKPKANSGQMAAYLNFLKRSIN